jgi:hypothetical protein
MPELRASYYLKAIDLYRQLYKHPVFLMMGDNVEWGKDLIMPRMPRAAIYPVGNAKIADQNEIGVSYYLNSTISKSFQSAKK